MNKKEQGRKEIEEMNDEQLDNVSAGINTIVPPFSPIAPVASKPKGGCPKLYPGDCCYD